MHAESAREDLQNTLQPYSSQTRLGASGALGEVVSQAHSDTADKIIYRYIAENEQGDIVKQLTDNKPIQLMEVAPVPVAMQTVLEVVTTKKYQTTRYFEETVLKIHSMFLINALREVAGGGSDVKFWKSPVKIYEP